MPRLVRASRALLPVALLVPILAYAQAGTTSRSRADAAFEREFGDNFLAAYWELNPDYAIAVGYYRVADRLIVPDDASRAAELAFVDRWQARLRRFKPETLNDSNRADWALLDNEFEGTRWALTEQRSWAWNPSNYNVAEPFAVLMNTEYAPLEQRLRTILRRLEHVPAYYAAARRSIAQATREHTQLAAEQNRGALAVFGEDMQKLVTASSLSERERSLFEERRLAAVAAIDNYISWLKQLDQQLERDGARPFRLGRELYERKFAYNIQSGGTAEALYQRAQQEMERLHTRMDQLADQLWPKYFPNLAPPGERIEKIGDLIERMSEQHVAREQFIDEVRRQIPELEQWVTEKQLVTLDPEKPLEVRVTPEYKRGVAMASIDAPGPYDPEASTYYNVTPLDGFTPQRAESFLREYNRWMLPILNIHEAVPGHYVQLVHANKSPSRIKTIFGNGAMIEGWASYAERMMLESGYGDHTAEMWLIYSKWSLRSVCNTILDYSVHVLDMNESDAKQLLTRLAFQSAEEAAAKWRRVQLTSVQLTSYFSGYSQIYDFREQLKREQGGQFDLRRFHEQFLSYGNAPVVLIKDLMRPRPQPAP